MNSSHFQEFPLCECDSLLLSFILQTWEILAKAEAAIENHYSTEAVYEVHASCVDLESSSGR